MNRSGSADLPLHSGRVPSWLARRMERLGAAIVEAVVAEHGRSGFLSRISDPFWFQALGAVMGMDWHSSGITTSVLAALKRGLSPLSHDLGIHVCGGRGAASRRTPSELEAVASATGLDGTRLVHASRLSAKVDNTLVQDGFSLYLHSFIVTIDGEWAVIQQGMDPALRLARRYHWHSTGVKSFVLDPHTAVIGENRGQILNMSDGRAEPAQSSIVSFMRETPSVQLRELDRVSRSMERTTATDGLQADLPGLLDDKEDPHLEMPFHHDVRVEDINSRRLGAVLATAWSSNLASFTDAVLLPGVGPRTIQALALVSEVIYGTPTRFQDPARFAFAHGGKDGHPFPVPLSVYDETISVLRSALDRARVDRSEKLDAIRALDRLCRRVETHAAPEADIVAAMQFERENSHRYGGRTVFGSERDA